ncbi:MAG: hypothetical protein WC563_10820 [Brevundimonas sp.]|jgi:hypothetical protein
MSLDMMPPRKRVLADHKRVRSKLVTPFNEMFGPLGEVSWVNTMIPELLWIALLQEVFGPHKCVELLTAFTRDLRSTSPERADVVWAGAGQFSTIPPEELCDLITRKAEEYGNDIKTALRPLAAHYPSHPLNNIYSPEEAKPEARDIKYLTDVLAGMHDRASWEATMTQAHALWLAFDAKRLMVSPELSLAQFPKIDQYPNTEISRRIAASIRATMNQCFGRDGLMASQTSWPVEFWNCGMTLSPCEVADDIG